MALHLGTTHPLAQVAAQYCTTHSAALVGGVACGICWERAIRDDEQFVVLNELPRELDTDPDLIDDVAVDRAVAGHSITLTRAERRLAIVRLHRNGATANEIARALRMNHTSVRRVLAQQTEPAAVPAAA